MSNTLSASVCAALREHGVPNWFSFGELHARHGAQSPMSAGRKGKRYYNGHTVVCTVCAYHCSLVNGTLIPCRCTTHPRNRIADLVLMSYEVRPGKVSGISVRAYTPKQARVSV